MSSAFFYGTLMVPAILCRVIGNDGRHLTVAPAILTDHTRLPVKDADYPAVVEYARSKALFDHDLNQDERSVRGVLVKGLTPKDMAHLDEFEGDEYTGRPLPIHRLAQPEAMSLDSTIHLLSHSTPTPKDLPAPDLSLVYVWIMPISRLESRLWSYDIFVKEKLHRWVDMEPESEGHRELGLDEQTEIDKRLDTMRNGTILASDAEIGYDIPRTPNDIPDFGHGMLKYFNFAPGYTNLNNGSYGSLPKPVLRAVEEWGRECESRPDRFMRQTYAPLLTAVRERLATLIGASPDECVMVPNTSHGITTVLNNFEFQKGDVIVGFSTTYESVAATFQYLTDTPPHPALSLIKLTPLNTHASILEQFRSHLRSIPRHSGQQIVAIVDGIISNPGQLMPWEGMVAICKKEKVWSIVDAAHCVGQVAVDLSKSQPDFWVSNCHKWLFSKRGSAVLYIPTRNRAVIKSTIPSNSMYISPNDPRFPGDLGALFEWTGTMDFAPYLSVLPALDFREAIGGEKKIRDYCHFLALAGGRCMANIFGTSLLDQTDSGEFTAGMVDVRLPLSIVSEQSGDDLVAIRLKLQDRMLENDCFAVVHIYDGKWWVRASAQIWVELSDFERVALVLLKACRELAQ